MDRAGRRWRPGEKKKKKERKYGGRRREGETKRERSGGIESNWTNSVVWRVRRQFVQGYLFRIRMYVHIYIYMYTGPLETLPRLGVTRTKDEDIKHRIGTRHVVHASIKSTWKVTLVPRDTNLDMGATRPWRSSATHPRLANCLKSDRAEAVGLIKR